jgi:spermidine/putrescine transport system permease protein
MMSKKPQRAPLEYSKSFRLRAWIAGVLIFLYSPLLILIAFSFNDSKRNIVWKGFTFKWYAKVFENDGLREALFNSLIIAVLCTIFSVILGALAAFVLWRFKFPMKGFLESGLNLPIVVPEICMGVGVLMFFNKIHWPNDLPWPISLAQIVIAHITFSFPFVAVVVRARLESFNKELEAAALDLGASQWRAFMDVIVPHMTPGLIAGALLAFTLSLDDFVITFFASGPGTVTFPIKVYSMVRFSVTPEVNAASTIIIVLTLIATAVAMKFQDTSPKKENV